MNIRRLIPLIALMAFPCFAQSDEGTIRKLFEEKLKTKVEKVSKTPLPGIYEVISDGQVIYSDEKANYMFVGNLVELRTMRNITGERKFSLLPLDMAVKQVRGSGKNVLVTFEDPNCGYCKRLAKDLSRIKDLTLYTFLLPVLSEDSVEKTKAIWCAPDKAKAWNDWMISGTTPPSPSAKCDPNPMLDKTQELSQRLGIRGTPFLLFANGQQSPGYIPASEIERRFNATPN